MPAETDHATAAQHDLFIVEKDFIIIVNLDESPVGALVGEPFLDDRSPRPIVKEGLSGISVKVLSRQRRFRLQVVLVLSWY